MSSSSRRRAFGSFVAALLLESTIAPSLRAAPAKSEVEAARESFKAGLEAEKAGDYEKALGLFEQTAKVKSTPQVKFHVALCHDKLGKLKLAVVEYEAAAKDAEATGAPEVLKVAPDLAEKARARLARLTLTYANKVVPAKVQIDGEDVDTSVARGGIEIDPGPHVVVATSTAGKEFRAELKLAEKEDKWVAVTLPPGPDDAAATDTAVVETPTVDPEPSKAGEGPRPVDDAVPRRSSRATYGLVLGSVGVVSLGLSGLFYGIRASAVSSADAQCPTRTHCPASIGSNLDKAQTYTTLSRVALGVGVLSIGAGVYLFVTGRKPETTTAGVRLVPFAPSASVGFGLEGAF